MARQNVRSGPPNNFHIVCDKQLAEDIDLYHRSLDAAGMTASRADTIRELIRIGLSSGAQDEALIQTRVRAWNTSRHWVMGKLADALNELGAQIQNELSLEVLRGREE